MVYEEKEMKVNELNIEGLISDSFFSCEEKIYGTAEIPLKEGFVRITRPTFLRHGTVIQAELYATDEQLIQYLDGMLNSYSNRWNDQNRSLKELSSNSTLARDSFSLFFEKEINAAEFLEGDEGKEDEGKVQVNIPLSIQISPGRLKKDEEDFIVEREPSNKLYSHEVDGEEVLDYCPSFVGEVILNSEKMDQINSKYLAKRGISKELHEKAIMMAETAKRALGFDYIERKGNCFKQVCTSPKEYCLHPLSSILLEDTYNPSFKELVVNFRNKGKYNDIRQALDIEITGGVSEDILRLMKIEATGEESIKLFQELFRNQKPEIPEGSVMSYTELKKSIALKTIEAIGNGLAKIPVYAIGDSICKGKEIFAKRKEKAKMKRDEEDKLLTDHFKSLGIRTNATRGDSCLFQYDRGVCLNEARAGQEQHK